MQRAFKATICVGVALLAGRAYPPSAVAAPLDGLESRPADADFESTLIGPDDAGTTQDSTPSAQSARNVTAIKAAREAFAKKNISASLELLTVAKAQDPTLPPPRLILADMFYQSGARPSGRAMLERVAMEDPSHPELWRLMGSVALTEQRWAEAIMHFEHGLELPAPPSWTPVQKQTFAFSVKKGIAAANERRGDLQAAATVLGELAEMAPTDSSLRDRYASLLFKADNKEKAYEQFKIAYLRDDAMSPPELSMGIMYVNDGNFDQGDRWFARAAKMHPANGTVHFQIAVALMVQDRAKESAHFSDRAAQLGLDSADLNMVRGYAMRQLRLYEEAERFFRESLKQRPDDAAAMNQLALVLIEQNNEEKQQEALTLARTVFEEREDSANAQATLGWVLYRSGMVGQAENVLREAVQKPGIGPEGLYLAGRAFADQGNNSDAALVAEKLSGRIASPGIYVLRPVAQKWLASQADTAAVEATP